MQQPTTDDYIRQLQDPDKDIRRNAAWRLGRVRDITVITPLLQALHDSDAEVRVRAAESLSSQRDPRIAPAILNILESESDADTRVHLIRALGYQEAPDALPMLEDLLERDANSEVRSAAAAALGDLHTVATPDTVQRLVSALTQESEAVTRHQIARALQHLGGMSAAALIQSLKPELDEVIQLQVIELIGLLGATGGTVTNAEDALTPFLNSPQESIRETAQWALNRLRSSSIGKS